MVKHYLRSLVRDSFNRVRFGSDSPRYAELLWVDSECCGSFLHCSDFTNFYRRSVRSASGMVVDQWPDKAIQLLSEIPKYNYCYRHWVDGLSWKDAGAFDYTLQKISESSTRVYDGLSTLADVEKRFDILDRVFDLTKEANSLMPQGDLVEDNYRERGGILIHIGPDGKPYFAGSGYHRFAIAKILNLRFPAQVGCVHVDALDRLTEYRQYCKSC